MPGWARSTAILQRLSHVPRRALHFKPHRISASIEAPPKVQVIQYLQLPRYASSARTKRTVKTLDPSRLYSVDQDTLDLSGISNPEVHISTSDGPTRVTLYYCFQDGKKIPFPPFTSGALYFDYAAGDTTRAQIRFRLCDETQDFHLGSDLLLPDGQPWKIALLDMTRSPNSLGLFADMISDEFPDIPHVKTCVISTFSPKKLVDNGQEVFNISGLTNPRINCASVDLAEAGLRNSQIHYYRKDDELHPFPEGTVGLFYYKQSLSSPKHIGEVRFRLCSDATLFGQGSDLCLPSGDPWCLESSALLFSTTKHKDICLALTQEGLLEPSRHFDSIPSDLHPRLTKTSSLGSFSEPFIVDLSQNSMRLALRLGSTWELVRLPGLFPQGVSVKDAPFSGRVIARLERYPQNLLKSAAGKSPLLALRFLETLTPVRRVNDTGHILKPTVGMLHLTRQRGGGYLPWGYNPTNRDMREKLLAFMQQSAPTT